MYNIAANNVNGALPIGLKLLSVNGRLHASRNGDAIRHPGPVATTYQYPTERVLFDPKRNANPFFHFFEALWILAGQNDVNFLAQFNSRIVEYSDDGVTFHGAYGFRLREHFGHDQIEKAISMIRKDPATRRVVLGIWDADVDLGAITKDVPCNDIVMMGVDNEGLLNIMVCCRSNDMIWGAYGANVVQFSMLQEYIAARAFVGMGTYTQLSYDFHVYESNEFWQWYRSNVGVASTRMEYDPYSDGNVRRLLMDQHDLHDANDVEESRRPIKPYPLFEEAAFDVDLERFFDGCFEPGKVRAAVETDAFEHVVMPLYYGWQAYKRDDLVEAMAHVNTCAAEDWRLAAQCWLRRVEHKRATK